MSFEYGYAYEDRGQIHTSRWLLSGVSTKADGNLKDGRVWATFGKAGDTVTVDLYNDPDCGSGDKVATGTADVSDIEAAAAKCTLSEANGSGLTGQVYLEQYVEDPAGAVEVLVSLCGDVDLEDEHAGLSDLPVYDASVGMARYCAVSTQRVLLLASQMYAEELGGYGAPEHRYRASALRRRPDFRRLANPDQLKDTAVQWALTLALGACHERAEDTMYSRLRDYHDAKRTSAIERWNLALNTDPDYDEDADTRKSSGMVRTTRV